MRRLRVLLAMLLALSLIVVPVGAEESDDDVDDDENTEETEDDGDADEPETEDVALFFHGENDPGELDWAAHIGQLRRMTTVEPTDDDAKSTGLSNYVVGPNTQCSGNNLLPSWQAFMNNGSVVNGDITVTVHTLGAPDTTANVLLFTNGNGNCNEDYVEPFAEQQVEFAAGEDVTEIVFEDVEVTLGGSLEILFHAGDSNAGLSQGRVFYDGAEAPSGIEFECEIPEGRDSCTIF